MSTRAMVAAAVALALAGAALLVWGRQATPSGAAPVVVATVSPSPASPADPIPAPAPKPSAAASTPTPMTPTPSSGAGRKMVDDVDIPAPAPSATSGDATVLAATLRVAQAFARPQARVTQQQWWARLEPLLSDQARSDYLYVQGREVPFTRVIAEPLMETATEGEDAHLSATALVPTDAGTYEVQLITVDGTHWLAARITALEDPA